MRTSFDRYWTPVIGVGYATRLYSARVFAIWVLGAVAVVWVATFVMGIALGEHSAFIPLVPLCILVPGFVLVIAVVRVARVGVLIGKDLRNAGFSVQGGPNVRRSGDVRAWAARNGIALATIAGVGDRKCVSGDIADPLGNVDNGVRAGTSQGVLSAAAGRTLSWSELLGRANGRMCARRHAVLLTAVSSPLLIVIGIIVGASAGGYIAPFAVAGAVVWLVLLVTAVTWMWRFGVRLAVRIQQELGKTVSPPFVLKKGTLLEWAESNDIPLPALAALGPA